MPATGVEPQRQQWPGIEIVTDETPEAFASLAKAALDFLAQHPATPPIITIGCWNEWTEGQYLLPDTKHGYGMGLDSPDIPNDHFGPGDYPWFPVLTGNTPDAFREALQDTSRRAGESLKAAQASSIWSGWL